VRGRALEAPDALANLLDTGTGDGRIHVPWQQARMMVCSLFVPIGRASQTDSDGDCPNRIVNDGWEIDKLPGPCQSVRISLVF
jgi:hypothetical protein